MDNDFLKTQYIDKFTSERMKTRYLILRRTITSYALEYCVSSYDKIGLTETEVECIKERAHTYITYMNDINSHQSDYFPEK